MDPNVVLAHMRDLMIDNDEAEFSPECQLAELQEAFKDLDNWLTSGGFLPSRWQA